MPQKDPNRGSQDTREKAKRMSRSATHIVVQIEQCVRGLVDVFCGSRPSRPKMTPRGLPTSQEEAAKRKPDERADPSDDRR
eukprot:8374363-Pyramimonas_sp.AAC.1